MIESVKEHILSCKFPPHAYLLIPSPPPHSTLIRLTLITFSGYGSSISIKAGKSTAHEQSGGGVQIGK